MNKSEDFFACVLIDVNLLSALSNQILVKKPRFMFVVDVNTSAREDFGTNYLFIYFYSLPFFQKRKFCHVSNENPVTGQRQCDITVTISCVTIKKVLDKKNSI